MPWVNTTFVALAALMLAVALVCVLIPMLRSARRNGRPRAIFVLALLLAFALPPAAIALYAFYGAPRALVPAPDAQLDMAAATAQLRAKLLQAPGDVNGWLLLGQAYSAMNRPVDARDAFGRALKLKPDDPDIMVAWSEADAQANPDHRIGGVARSLLQRAVALQPEHQRGLWLLGISDYQLGHYDDASASWRRLLPLLPAGSKLAVAVNAQIAMAQARAQGKNQTQAETIGSRVAAQAAHATSSGVTDAASTSDVALKVEVKLDQKLAAKMSPGDTLFVFARAIGGPPMPLAVARLRASQLPATVTLTDAMAMAPQLKLSMYPRVEVSARISKSGNALPQAGDLEAPAKPVASDSREPVVLTIDRVH